eukprot:TRINITY_DN6133_c0_g1_i1.p1 TRINITY_DN6133_c0_g1~~TRINITY_DN6133_c0_g1_i1.p1  ORF type:complete len:547 (-),score=111.26 TRINITY_DN6133_c0_g1_i1:29-1669(-)
MDAPRNEDGAVIMTEEYIKYLCEKERQYRNPKLNDKLYLNNKGFSKIDKLAPYVGVEAIWLNSNCIEKIEGLDTMKKLRLLYLHDNFIKKIENVNIFSELMRLDLSRNLIATIEGLEGLTKLKDLSLDGNLLSCTDSLQGACEASKSLTFFNIANNKIKLDERLMPFLKSLEAMISLDIRGNPVTKEMKNYKKEVIAGLPHLAYLDGNPIEDVDKLAAEAYIKGGLEEERKYRAKYNEEKKKITEHEKEKTKDYDKQVDERMKKTVTKLKQEIIDKYTELLKSREELISHVDKDTGLEKHRTILRLIKIEKDLRNIKIDYGRHIEEKEPLNLVYADMSAVEYLDAIKAPEDYKELVKELITEKSLKIQPDNLLTSEEPQISKQEQPEIPMPSKREIPQMEEMEIPPLEEVKVTKSKYKWSEEDEEELEILTIKHTFNFEKILEEFTRQRYGSGLTIQQIEEKYAEIEKRKFRKPECNPMEEVEQSLISIHKPVSYTHLTLPTILLVQISVVAVSLKKKKQNKMQLENTSYLNDSQRHLLFQNTYNN